MRRIELGGTGVEVTELMLGCSALGGLYRAVDDREARATLDASWAAGVHAFDTAPHYGVGLAEERLGAFLAALGPSRATVSTKVGRLLVPTDEDVEGVDGFFGTPRRARRLDYSRDGVRRSVADSLERMGLERIDIALVHDPDEHLDEAVEQSLPALAELRDEGVVGAIGAGMNDAGALAFLVERADLDCVLVAGRYSLLRDDAAVTLFPLCEQRGVAVLAGGVYQSGILAAPTPGAHVDYRPARSEELQVVEAMAAACARAGVPLAAAALQFVLRHPAVSAIVVGARSPAEATANAGYLGERIPEELWAELGELAPG